MKMHRRIRDGDRLRFKIAELLRNDHVESLDIDFVMRDGRIVAAWPTAIPFEHAPKSNLTP